jgi:two-component system, NarL family, sensor histidine kinase BarA
MSEGGLFHISLAAKCRVLFGLAVALIIAAALFVPWYSMETLVHDRNVQRVRNMALLAHAWVDPASADWDRQQGMLDQWWNDNAKLLKLPEARPRLIRTSNKPIPPDPEALRRLEKQRRTLEKWFTGADEYVPFAQAAEALWAKISPDVRSSVAATFMRLRVLLAIRTERELPPLDSFQRRAIAEMREHETTNEMPLTEREPGQPRTYRYIVAVRDAETAGTRRPLVGIIDARLPLPSTDETLLVTRVVIVIAGLLAGFLAILVFYLITQKLILAPVRELKRLAEQISGGDLTARSNIKTGDEFQELSGSFNDMLARLERSRVELEMINRSLDVRLGELAESNVALYESNKLKSEFLANVSHELRTPLTSIIGFADLLRDIALSNGPIDTNRATRYATNILTSGRLLLDIINDLLDLAKIEAGKVELHRTTFAVHDLCEDLVDFMRPLADKKQLTLNVDLPEDLPLMTSDPGKLRQVLYNLLSNAVKYTPEGGTVAFSAELSPVGSRVRLAVSDTGPGISPEDQERIFEKFRQLDSSVTREHSGTGLGLAISRELCMVLGGRLWLESELGKGSTFIAELPVQSPESARRPLTSLT